MTKSNWQQQIDQELGAKKWNRELSRAIEEKALQLDERPHKVPVIIPFVSMAIVTIIVFLSLSYFPKPVDQAAAADMKFQQVYYSKLLAQEGIIEAQQNLAAIGMAQSSDQQLLQQLSTAFEQKVEIDAPEIYESQSMSVILYDEKNIAYPYNIYRTASDEIIFEDAQYQFYQYSGDETAQIFALLEREINLTVFAIILVIFVACEIMIPYAIRKYYAVPKRKETFDNITLNRVARWLPLPYLLYINFNVITHPVTLTWWEVIVPFLVYQAAVLFLMKQQKEPHPYIVERMLSFIVALIFLIIVMFML